MNPAKLWIEVHPAGDSAAPVCIEAHGQEGLIPQRTAAKAIARLPAELSAAAD